MKISKRYLSIFCSALLAVSMASCGGSKSENESTDNTETVEETSQLTSKQERRLKGLEMEIEKLSKQLPVDMGNGLKMQKMEIKDGFVITTISYPQDIEMEIDNTPEAKRTILEAAGAGSVKRFKELGLGLKYIYVEDGTDKSTEIVITNEEL